IGLMGATPVLVIDAATYLVSLFLVAVFVPQRPPAPQEEEHRSVRAGLRFIARDRLLRVWWPTFALGDAAWTAFFISVPVLVLDRFGHHASIGGLWIAFFRMRGGGGPTFHCARGAPRGLLPLPPCVRSRPVGPLRLDRRPVDRLLRHRRG